MLDSEQGGHMVCLVIDARDKRAVWRKARVSFQCNCCGTFHNPGETYLDVPCNFEGTGQKIKQVAPVSDAPWSGRIAINWKYQQHAKLCKACANGVA